MGFEREAEAGAMKHYARKNIATGTPHEGTLPFRVAKRPRTSRSLIRRELGPGTVPAVGPSLRSG
jgi:hypothetical protein